VAADFAVTDTVVEGTVVGLLISVEIADGETCFTWGRAPALKEYANTRAITSKVTATPITPAGRFQVGDARTIMARGTFA